VYYHVLIETKDNHRKMYELDKETEDEVLNEIIIPHILGEDIQFDGYFLTNESIDRVVIKQTEKSARDLAKFETENMPVGLIMVVTPQDIFDYDDYTVDITKKLFSLGANKTEEEEYHMASKEEKNIDKTKVFIVHGHDKLALTETAVFFRQLGLTPIILSLQANEGKTIIEKIESHSNVGFGVVLYTPCDVGAKEGNELQPRARQNVVFEHGFLIGKIGRKNVAALLKDKVEVPNDISGVVYIKMDDYQRWHIELAKELKSSGYDIDMNRFFE
jgi:predicted nucleotide-binding protein